MVKRKVRVGSRTFFKFESNALVLAHDWGGFITAIERCADGQELPLRGVEVGHGALFYRSGSSWFPGTLTHDPRPPGGLGVSGLS